MHDPTARTNSFTLDDAIGYLLKHRVYAPHKGEVQVLRQLNLTTKNLFLDIFWCCHPVVIQTDFSGVRQLWDVLAVQVNRPPTSGTIIALPQWGANQAWDRVLDAGLPTPWHAQSSVCQNQRYCGLQHPFPWPSRALLVLFLGILPHWRWVWVSKICMIFLFFRVFFFYYSRKRL